MFKTCFPQHIYIHWPFCARKCLYCDFISFQDHTSFEPHYHAALRHELQTWTKNHANQAKPLQTIFIGGGTPSLYPLHLITELFTTIHNHFDCSHLKEVTLECNPSDITEEKLDIWHSIGINRISMGVQILDDTILAILNRQQRVHDVERALTLTQKYFSNISVDLILGLPGVTQDIWHSTIQTAIKWPIKHISVYALTVYEKTPLYFSVKENMLKLLADEEMIELYLATIQTLESNNFIQYELSNFCQEGFSSVHNTAYWDRRPYRGFGLHASSFDGISRTTNLANLGKYIANMADSTTGEPYETQETLSPEQTRMETLMLGLRQKKGVDLQSMIYLISDTDRKRVLTHVAQLEEAGLIVINGGIIRLTPKGMALENEVVLKLL